MPEQLDDPSQPFFSPGDVSPGRSPAIVKPQSWLAANIAPLVGLVVVILGFAYLFLGIFFETKDGAAVIALIAGVVAFYFGATHVANLLKAGPNQSAEGKHP